MKTTIYKSTIAMLMAILLILSTFLPSVAAEQQAPDISPWAMGYLNEGERYGIFPMEWYFDDFRGEISEERLEALIAKTDAKIAALGLEKKEKYVPVQSQKNLSRGDVINRLFEIVAPYTFVDNKSAVSYMQERGVLKGSSQGLQLDQQATTEQAVIFAIRLIADTYLQANEGGKGVAWKVENDGNIVYLLGSIHLGIADLYPLHNKLLSAFHESDALLVEVNLFETEGVEYYLQHAMYQDGTTLKDTVRAETYEKLVKVLEKYEQPVDEYLQYKPWSLAGFLSAMSLSDSFAVSTEELANLGIDMYFLTNALLSQMPIVELEGYQAQTDMLNGLSSEAQEQYLVEVLDSILEPQQSNQTNEAELLKEWFEYWGKGEIDAFKESLKDLEGEPSEFNEMLFGLRDKHMSEKIIEKLEGAEKGTYFVVVGAGHFLTDESILYYLKQAGFDVQPFYN